MNIQKERSKNVTPTYILKNSVFLEKNMMGGACSADGGEERCVQGFGGET
jgi:hypothetical protein